ncbi:MAG: hypothetical protein A2275_05555 [Bacteroidetes bacterium RIFOXYA12_FULL_35_11]|nr:MAG: hypothetical protein A2X01_16485 [Bacteroidetes bacterium GWF2_35_48]OFY79538.1 MAG: hypothetical protein A2275_05555 [Bacteroidetes bacterium RIFOXYA12_FULL_35_11]OFY92732.1 MAG: hypothetical protein A2491_21015 [Bacteroidetes bacterium RIFOXYC12_FULL_35_7]OFY94951.1 MAG: hypothetical protein A2309_14525 [Bacteroidetes bacterium RIFOXYB2_FULL_35_7]HBX53440.1 hypothetical protein [Bacteroidales bacterium]
MTNPNDKPKLVVKKKNMQPVIEYCLENAVEFAVKHKPLPDDEWEIELNISTIKKAIQLGMFLRENRLYPVGMEPVVVPVPKNKKTTVIPKKEEADVEENEEETIQESTLSKSEPEKGNTLF